MPYVEEDDLDENNEEQGATEETVIAGDSGGVAGSGASGGSSAQGQAGFTNINQYLDVNKEQGQGLQEKVVGAVEKSGQDAQQAIDSGEQAFGQQVNAASYKPDSDYESQVATQASQVVQSPEQLREAQRRLTGQYAGPENRQTENETSATNKAVQNTNSLQDFSGRYGLLQQQFRRPDYGQGQQTLDNLLLTGSQGFGTRAQQAKASYGNLNDVLGASLGRSGAAVSGAKQGNQQAAQSLKGALGAEEQAQLAGATTRQNQATANFKAVQDALQAGDITPEQAQSLGLTEGMQTFGINPLDFLKQGDISQASAASPEQRAQLAALAQIQGQGAPALSAAASQLDINNPYSFDAQGYLSSIGSKKAGYDSLLGSTGFSGGSGLDKALSSSGSAQQKWEALQPYLNKGTAQTPGIASTSQNSLSAFLNPSGYTKEALENSTFNDHSYYKTQQKRAQDIQNILAEIYGANNTLK